MCQRQLARMPPMKTGDSWSTVVSQNTRALICAPASATGSRCQTHANISHRPRSAASGNSAPTFRFAHRSAPAICNAANRMADWHSRRRTVGLLRRSSSTNNAPPGCRTAKRRRTTAPKICRGERDAVVLSKSCCAASARLAGKVMKCRKDDEITQHSYRRYVPDGVQPPRRRLAFGR